MKKVVKNLNKKILFTLPPVEDTPSYTTESIASNLKYARHQTSTTFVTVALLDPSATQP